MKFLRNLPMAAGGFSAAFAALGNLLASYGDMIRYICGILSASMLFMFMLKLIFDWENVKKELKTPGVLSVFPTTTIAVILLCPYLKPFWGMISVYIWYGAVIAHLYIMALFIKLFVIDEFKLQNIFPGWFVVSTGIVAASGNSGAMGTEAVGRILFYLGFLLSLATAILVIYRMLKLALPEPLRPTIAIFNAPAGLIIVGHFSAFELRNTFLIYAMLVLALAAYIYVCFHMVSILKLKFYPTYTALTFPFVISAAGFRVANAFLVESGIYFFGFVPLVAQWIAVFMVIYVSLRYIIFLAPKKE